MSSRLKLAVLRISKSVGLFALSRYWTRGALRILCYHGFALAGENAFRAKLFITPQVFERRLTYLVEKGFPVLALEEATRRLKDGTLPPCATVITIDDGFYGVHRLAAPLLRKFNLPATTYVTSYYCQKGTPIFRLVVQYMFWKTKRDQLTLDSLAISRTGVVPFKDAGKKKEIVWEIIRFGEEQCGEPERALLAKRLGEQLGVDYESIVRERFMSLMTPAEIRELISAGMDIQLHTHRHRLPENREVVASELAENRAFLEPLAGKPLHHLCYPSGIWSPEHWPWLTDLGVETATTCDLGLNYASTPPLGLKRFLDADNIAQLEFESEMCGFSEFIRGIRRAFQFGRGESKPVNPYG